MIETKVKVYSQSGLGYFVSYRDPISKRFIKKRMGDREEAERFRDEIQKQLAQKIGENPGDMLVQDLMQIHLRDNPDTWVVRAKALIADFLDTFGTLQIKELTTDMLRSWLERMRIEKNYKESSANGAKVHINIFFRDLVKKGVVPVSPVEGIHYERRPIETMKKPIALSEEQLANLLKKAKDYSPGVFYPMFLAFVETGAKSAEIIDLTWDAVDFKNGTITFPGDKILLKRTIPISKELQEALKKKRPVLDFVFTSLYDERMTKRKISAYINEFKRHYGITDLWMYFDLRHSFAYNFQAKGGDLKRLKEILGVRSTQTLETVYKRPVARVGVTSPYEV
jgi:integrase